MKLYLFQHCLMILITFTILLTISSAESPLDLDQQQVDEELEPTQQARQDYAGTWQVDTITSNGNLSEPEKKIVIENRVDGTWTMFIDDEEFSSGTNAFDSLCDPKEIDISITNGEGQGSVLHGIYELSETTRKLCFRGGAGWRPSVFESLQGDESILVTFTQIK